MMPAATSVMLATTAVMLLVLLVLLVLLALLVLLVLLVLLLVLLVLLVMLLVLPTAGMSPVPMMPAVAAAPPTARQPRTKVAHVPARPVPAVVVPAIIVTEPDVLHALDQSQTIGRSADRTGGATGAACTLTVLPVISAVANIPTTKELRIIFSLEVGSIPYDSLASLARCSQATAFNP